MPDGEGWDGDDGDGNDDWAELPLMDPRRPIELPQVLADLDDGDREEREFAWRVVALARRWTARLDEELTAQGLTHARWQALFWISENDGSVTQQQLADRIGVASSTMVRTIDGLERQGLIRRIDSEQDKRAKVLRLTPDAKKILSDITDIASRVRKQALAALHPAEIAICDMVVTKMLGNLTGKREGADPG